MIVKRSINHLIDWELVVKMYKCKMIVKKFINHLIDREKFCFAEKVATYQVTHKREQPLKEERTGKVNESATCIFFLEEGKVFINR